MEWPLTILYTCVLALCIWQGVRAWKKHADWPVSVRAASTLLPAMAVSTAALFLSKIFSSIYHDHNWERLQTAFAFAHGHPIYHSMNSGPILNTLYGPVSVFAYVPAAIFNTPTPAMITAAVLTVIYGFLPPAVIFAVKAWRKEEGIPEDPDSRSQHRVWVFLAFLVFAYAPFLCSPLRIAVFNIHADAPALGLASAACAFIYLYQRKKRFRILLMAAFVSALAVWSKQVNAPLIPALSLYLWIAEGRGAAFRYFMAAVISGLALGAIFLKMFGTEPLLLNMFVIPGKHPWREGWLSYSSFKLLRECIPFFIMSAFSIVPFLIHSRKEGALAWIKKYKWSLFLIAAVFLIPTSLVGNSKIGGSNNTLSYTCYFFLLAAVLGFIDPFTGPFQRRRYGLLLVAAIFLAIQIPSVYYRIFTFREPNYAETVYAYIKKNPGKGYFPRLNVLNVMAEDKVYHASVALMDREWANLPVTQEHLRAWIPERLELIAFHETNNDDKQYLDLPEYGYTEERHPDLPGFRIHWRRSS